MPLHASTNAACEFMPRFMPDTNCIVALISSRHEHHEHALGEIERRLDAGETLVLAAHTLVETYSVLTRLPMPNRLSPTDCRSLLEANFSPEVAEVVTLSPDGYRRLIHDAPASNLSGGRVYDAVIAACARAAHVGIILTFNVRHFASFAGEDLAIVAPS